MNEAISASMALAIDVGDARDLLSKSTLARPISLQPNALSASPSIGQSSEEDTASSSRSRRLIAFLLDVGGMDEAVPSLQKPFTREAMTRKVRAVLDAQPNLARVSVPEPAACSA